MKLNFKLYLAFFVLIFGLLFSHAYSMGDEEYLDWHQRPPSVASMVDYKFNELTHFSKSSWNLHNGNETYDHLYISQLKLAKKIIEDAHKEGRKDVYILDSGAGNFQSCDAFAKYINDHRYVLPQDITVHIIGTRGEGYEGKEIEQIGPCKVYKFGSFKIEEHEEELKRRGLNLRNGIDLTISNWANRHFVDSLTAILQFIKTTRPKTGLLIMDWCYYLYEGENLENRSNAFTLSRNHLLDLLLHLNFPFLLDPHGDAFTTDVDRFVIRRENENPLKIPLAYKDIQNCNGEYFDIGSRHVVKFKVLDPTFTTNKFKNVLLKSLTDNTSSYGSALWGDLELFQWFKMHNLVDEDFFYCKFDQLFQTKKDQNQIFSLYTEEDISNRKNARKKKSEGEDALNKKIDETKKQFFSSLKSHLPEETPPVVEGIANGAREIEHFLWRALRNGDFENAQILVDKGADVNRVFEYSFFNKTLLDFAITSEFSHGTLQFLLKNKAKTQDASLDNALYFYHSFENIKLLIDHGIPIKDVNLALYRSISRGDFKLIDLFISLGGNSNKFINGLPMIYGTYSPEVWNYLIDKGAKDAWGKDLPKKTL